MSLRWGSRWKKKRHWVFPYRQKKSKSGTQPKAACDKSSSSRFLFSAARNAITKVTEYVTIGFSFRILYFFPFRKSLNVTVCKRYEFFSVLAATIRENFQKQPWIENGDGFALHLSTWLRGKKLRPVTCQQLIDDIKHTRQNIVFFYVCCFGFSQGWKSLYNTIVYMIINKFSP